MKREADPTTRPARKAGLGAPVESPALPSPDVEVLIKKITELRAELGWWVEFSKFLVGGERQKCDPAACQLRGQLRARTGSLAENGEKAPGR